MSALGAFSFFYLQKALASSREATLQRRAERLAHFVNEQGFPVVPLNQLVYQFSLVSPESDFLTLTTPEGNTIFRNQPHVVALPWPNRSCDTACFDMVTVGGRRMRVLHQMIVLQQHPYRLTLAGQIDEHYEILRMVRNSYLISLPLLLLTSVLGGVVLADRTLEPIDRMTRTAQTISIRDLRKRLVVPNTGDEIQRFAVAWNDLLGRLEGAVQRLTQFTSDISHDLRTTLTVMSATAQVSAKRERTSVEYQQALRIIISECETTTSLLDDLLAASRTDAGNQDISLTLVPLAEVAEEVCGVLSGRAEVRQQVLRVVGQQDSWVMGDLSLIRRLITILVDNALKYTPSDGHITVSVTGGDTGCRLEVIDDGIGIASQDIGRVFDRFYRADASRNRESGGAGLGLAIAKWIVEVHSATIYADSDLGKGSRFSVCFPTLSEHPSTTSLSERQMHARATLAT